MRTLVKVILLILLLLPLFAGAGFVWYTALDDPDMPSSFEEPVYIPAECVPDEPCAMEDGYGWTPTCDEYACYDEYDEELCPTPDGPYYDEFGPYYETEWEYCDVISWTGDTEFFGVDEDTLGAVMGVGVPFVTKSIAGRILGGSQTQRIVKAVRKVMEDE